LNRFGFIIHPLFPKDLQRYYPIVKYLPDRVIEEFLKRKSPVVASRITGVKSKTGVETEGWFMGLPLVPRLINTLPVEVVYEKISKCVDLAEAEGAVLCGLGAFSSVVGDGGVTVAGRAKIGVTTGNSYTVATAIAGTLQAVESLEIDPANSTLAVVGATGSIGKTCAKILSRQFGRVILIGRDLERTQEVAAEMPNATATTDLHQMLAADAIVTVSSAAKELILPEHLKPGCVVCDVARPRDVSVRVAKERPDVLVIEGGVIKVPGNVEFNFPLGFPPGTAYACMSETMILALEGDPSLYNFTVGKDVSVEQVDKISELAVKHGFELAGLRSFEKALDPEAITRAKKARVMAPTVPRIINPGTPDLQGS
jgi:fatty aldehyde-generating acyl-ACP reductase